MFGRVAADDALPQEKPVEVAERGQMPRDGSVAELALV